MMMVTVMMMMAVMMMSLLNLTNDVWTLPAPSRVTMESVDMRHVLAWRPLQAPCNTTVLYRVQFQGEFELTVLNDSWVDAPECQRTPHARCDLTFDLGSDSDYNLRVRAQCGSRRSPWTQLGSPFNRRDTILTAPHMQVTPVGDSLQVMLHELPVTAVVRVTVWKRGDERKAAVYIMSSGQTTLAVAALQEGEVYCVRAQTLLDTHTQLNSSGSSDAQCVSVTGPETAWKSPTTAVVTVIATATFLVAMFWLAVHCWPDAHLPLSHKEPLPRSLQSDWDINIVTSAETPENFEPVCVVPGANGDC